jgi:TPR repeat protein
MDGLAACGEMRYVSRFPMREACRNRSQRHHRFWLNMLAVTVTGCAGTPLKTASPIYDAMAPPTVDCNADEAKSAPIRRSSRCVAAVLELAQRYREGRDVEKDAWLAALTVHGAGSTSAAPWLRERVAEGDLYAELVLTELESRENDNDNAQAQTRLKQVLTTLTAAAEAGDARAAAAVATAIRLGWDAAPSSTGPVDAADRSRARRWLQQAAEAGYAPAQFELGSYYDAANAEPIDHMLWFQKAADQGHPEAQRFVAMHEDAVGHHELATEWFRKAAENGEAAAQFELGIRLRVGSFADREPTQAAHWLRRAADQGHAGALFVLGVMFERGEGVRSHAGAAQQCFRLAAIRDHRVARFLAPRPQRSDGVPLANALQQGQLNPHSPETQLLANIERQYALHGPDSNVSASHLWFELQAHERDLERTCTHSGFDSKEVTCRGPAGLAATATTDGSLLVERAGQVLLYVVPCECRPGAAHSCSDRACRER